MLVAGQVFGKHMARWIETSQAALCVRCQQIEASGYATAMLAERADEGAPCRFLFRHSFGSPCGASRADQGRQCPSACLEPMLKTYRAEDFPGNAD